MPTDTGFERKFTLRQTLNAPPDKVFEAWTEPQQLDWFFSDLTPPGEPVSVDLRVGGEWRQRMIVAEDTEYVTGGVYREIVPVERLVFSWGATDGWPKVDFDRLDAGPLVTVTLASVGAEQTEMVFRFALSEHWSDDELRVCRQGWSETLDRLVAKFAARP